MTINDIVYYMFDGQELEIFDCEKGKTVWSGDPCDLPLKYENTEVGTIEGVDGKIIINI